MRLQKTLKGEDMKRAVILAAATAVTALASSIAQAHTDIGVYLGVPGPVIVAPPPVVYQAPPVVYSPAPAMYGYPYEGEYREHREWRDEGWHRREHHHHHDHGDD